MIYFFFLLFCVFSIIDYIYIYTYLDSKIFYSKNGSKLGRYIKDNKSKYESLYKSKQDTKIETKNLESSKILYNIFSKDRLLKIVISIFLFIFIQFLFIIFFKDIIFSNFIIIDLGYKELELVSTFGNYFIIFKYLYFILLSIFSFIIIFRINQNNLLDKLFIFRKKEDNKVTDTEEITIAKNFRGENINIPINGLYQNLLITGSIGSGKTSAALANITDELIGKGYSGLILDIKGNYVNTVERICKKYEKQDKLFVLSDKNDFKYNPLGCDILPIEMASRLRQVIEIISPSNNSDTYWLDKVENVLFNMIILIRYYNFKKVDFMEIHKLATNNEYLENKIEASKEKILKEGLDDKAAFEMVNVFAFFEKEYMAMENRIKNIISSEITRLTIPFVTNYDIYKRFGSYDENNSISKLKQDCIFVLSINIANNRVLSKMLSTFIKLEFQKLVISNMENSKTKFLIADEYQEFSNIEDSHFFSLSREAKCINVLSMQSYTSLKQSLKNEYSSQVIIQNMVNKIWFRNDDNYTVGEIVKQIGKEDITKENITVSEGAQETKKNLITRGFKNKKSNIQETINYVQSKENIYDENYFTKDLKTFEAITFLSDGISIKKIQKVKFERWDINNEREN